MTLLQIDEPLEGVGIPDVDMPLVDLHQAVIGAFEKGTAAGCQLHAQGEYACVGGKAQHHMPFG